MGFTYRNLIRPLLFRIDPERAHELTARWSKRAARAPLLPLLLRARYGTIPPSLATTVAGVTFPGPVGMGAGFDKDGSLYPFLTLLGFGYVESGTFTALKQDGNPRPRVFRFPKHSALVNRMGFNNPGATEAVEILRTQKRTIPRGINIGKSKAAELADAAQDYLRSLTLLEEFADYVTVNVSSPNTPGLRSLQTADTLAPILEPLLRRLNGRLPLFVKLSPDMPAEDFEATLQKLKSLPVAGVVLTNTTLDRRSLPEAEETTGGLSGAPLRDRSTECIRMAYRVTGGNLPIIGVGGISTAEHALEKIRAGAALLQVYTGLIYEGPDIASKIHAGLADELTRTGQSLSDLVGSGA